MVMGVDVGAGLRGMTAMGVVLIEDVRDLSRKEEINADDG